MSDYSAKILSYLNRIDYEPLTAERLKGKLNVPVKKNVEFVQALDLLKASRRIRINQNGLVRLREKSESLTGTLKRFSSGAGVVLPGDATAGDRAQEIYISQRDIRDGHTGDKVLIKLLNRRRSGGQRCGRIIDVVERATTTFVGTYLERFGQGYVKIDGRNFHEPMVIDDPGAKGASTGDKIVVEILRFPAHFQEGEAVLVEILGAKGEQGVDTLSIVHEFGLPTDFPDGVLDEARKQVHEFDEKDLGDRTDLTRETIVTIDPADARDFDDAISLKQTTNGHWVLGVHIADVAHYVKDGSQLDSEAQLRGNSVYLPGHVIPMLPEILSNGLASLQKGKIRLTKTVFIEFDPQGLPVHTEFANTVIKVSRRFAYQEVMPLIEEPENRRSRVSMKVRKLLKKMHQLAMLLRKRRFAAGALELHLKEVKIDFDKNHRVTGAHEAEHDESHQIIEEFMLAANIAVAQELSDREIIFPHRAHGDPSLAKLKAFAEFAKALGYTLERPQSRRELQQLIQESQGEPTEYAVNYALLRSLKQAVYTPEEEGHYALAVEDYCHFTSPIRRYPDLIVHRIFDTIVRKKKSRKKSDYLSMTKLCQHCCTTERRAIAAERELTKLKLLTFMQEKIGEEINAVITGVENFGIFCQGVEIPVEGFIHIGRLDRNDYFDHESSTFSLVARRSGMRFRLGDRIRVKVAKVDLDSRELDFLPVESVRKSGKNKRKKKLIGKKKKKKPAARKKKKPRTKKKKRGNRS